MAEKHIEVGDKVQWNYGAGHPQGVAAEIKTQPGEKVQIESRKGNTVSRNADEENPAVRVERQGDGNNQDVVKRMSELTKVGEGKEEKGEEKDPVVGEKRGRGTSEKQDKVGTKAAANGADEAGEKADETEAKKATGEVKSKKPKAKKAKVDERDKAADEEQEVAGAKLARGRGRGREKTAATTTGTRRAGHTKKGSLDSQGKPASTRVPSGEGKKTEGVSGNVDEAMSEANPETEGGNEEGVQVKEGETPAEHTRSKDAQAPAHN